MSTTRSCSHHFQMKLYINLRGIYVSKGTFQCLYMTTRSESLAPSPYLEDINIVNKNEPVYTKLSDCTEVWHGINNSNYQSFVQF